MSLKPGEESVQKSIKPVDQFFRFEGGKGKCIIDGNEYVVENGDAIVVPAGSKHNVINTSTAEGLKMYTIYAPPNHKDGIINPTKKRCRNSMMSNLTERQRNKSLGKSSLKISYF